LSRGRKIFIAAFVLVVAASVGMRIYKARYAGMTYDETMTFFHYGSNLHNALHSYTHTNNHILNSVMVYWAYQSFRNVEHFVRLPSLAAGIWFVIAASYIVLKVVKDDVLRVVGLVWAVTVPLVFDYSFMARGNAMAIAAIYTQIALVIFLLGHKVDRRFFWVPALLIAVLNFIAFGAMLASVMTLAAFNMCYCLLYCHFVVKSGAIAESNSKGGGFRKWLTNTFLNIAVISAASGGMSYMLYRGVLETATGRLGRSATRVEGDQYPDFFGYIYELLGESVFGRGNLPGGIIYAAVILAALVGAGFLLWRFFKAVRKPGVIDLASRADGGNLVILVTIVAVALLFVFNVVLGRRLAYMRYHLYIIPMFLLSVVIIIERFCAMLRYGAAVRWVRVAAAVLIVAVIVGNLPSHINILNGSMSISRPLLVKLKEADPNKVWKIGFSPKMQYHYMGFTYYGQFGYRFQLQFQGPPDVMVLKKDECPEGAVDVDKRFFDKADCAVIYNRPSTDG
jgi:hypothetical protein